MDEIKLIHIVVNDVFGIEISEKNRHSKYVNARACYYYLCKRLCNNASLFKIGQEINRNHATVSCALKNTSIYIKSDGFDEQYKEAEQKALLVLSKNQLKLKSNNLLEHFHNQYHIVKRKNEYLTSMVVAMSNNALKRSVIGMTPEEIENLVETRILPYRTMQKENKRRYQKFYGNILDNNQIAS